MCPGHNALMQKGYSLGLNLMNRHNMETGRGWGRGCPPCIWPNPIPGGGGGGGGVRWGEG